jgi:glycine cleavage system H protein
MRFSSTHEWIVADGTVGTVGITVHAKKELGEIVYIELPKVGSKVNLGDEICVLESTKAAADIYSPVSGEVIEVNEALKTSTEVLNKHPQGQGWLFKIALTSPEELSSLLTHEEYCQLVE